MSRFLRFCAFLSVLFFATNVFASGYTCPSYKRYTSCNSGYYLNGTQAGNSCDLCPSGCACSGGTAQPDCSIRVTYNLNGGGGTTPSAKQCTSGVSCSLQSGATTSFYRAGYVFKGWSTSSTATSGSTTITVSSSTTVYAVWSKCGTGTYKTSSAQASAACSTCPEGYRSGSGTTAQGNCLASCEAGYAVVSEGGACTSIQDDYHVGMYTTSHTVKYGELSTLNRCPQGYIYNLGTTAQSNCRTLCSAGYAVLSVNDTCRKIDSMQGVYTPEHFVYYGDKSEIVSCPTGYQAGHGTTAKEECIASCEAGSAVVKEHAECTSIQTDDYLGKYTEAHTVKYGALSTLTMCQDWYQDGKGAKSQFGCIASCKAGYAVLGQGGPCTSIQNSTYKGKYITAHTVNYGGTSTIKDCPTDYQAGNGTTAQSNCTTSCSAGYAVLSAKSACTSIQNATYKGKYITAHSVKYGGTSTIKDCPTDYQAGNGTTAQSNCTTSCSAGYAVLSANGACTTIQNATYTGKYTTAHTVKYGATSTISTCPTNYQAGNGTTAKNECKIACSAGKAVLEANGACERIVDDPAYAGHYTDDHTVKYGEKTAILVCPDGYRDRDTGSESKSGCQAICPAGYAVINPGLGCVNIMNDEYTGQYTDEHYVKYEETSEIQMCPDDYRAGKGAKAISGCLADCPAGYAVLTAGGACTSIQNSTYKGKYITAHTVNYGDTTTISTCPTNYQAGNGTTAQANCSLVTTAGKYVATAGAGETACVSPYYCPGGTTIKYGTGTTVGGNTACTSLGSFYTKSAGGAIDSSKCYGTTTAGKYIKTQNSSTQETCPAGSYCAATNVYYGKYDTSGGRTACPAGTMNASTGASTASACTTCSAGTYNTTTGSTSCSNCGTGYYCTGGSARTQCTTTSGWTTTTSTEKSTSYSACYQTQTPSGCASGVIKRTASSISGTTITYGNPSVSTSLSAKANYYVSETACPACTSLGSFYTTSAGGAINSSKCYGTTTAGKYIKTQNSSTQETCPAGSYCPATTVYYGKYDTSGGRVGCGAGKYNASTGSSASSACANITAGCYGTSASSSCPAVCGTNQYSTAGSSSCSSCPSDYKNSGTEAASHAGSASCIITVSGGKYIGTAGDNSSNWDTCAGGTYKAQHTVAYGSTSSCATCSAGYYCPAGASSQTACGSNAKYSSSGAAACSDVSSGYYTTGGTSTTRTGQTKCEAGNYCSGGVKTACGGGKYSSAGATSCSNITAGCYGTSASTACPAVCGTNQYSTAGSSSCSSCPSDYKNSGTEAASHAGSASCIITVSGGYYIGTAGDNSSNWDKCAGGKYKAQHTVAYGSTSSCATCSAGYYCPEGASSQTACGGNTKYSGSGAASCSTVTSGYYTTGGTATTRTGQTKCEAGNYCSDGVKTACGGGKYSAAGATSCSNITAGCYGTSASTACPAVCGTNQYSAAGSSSCSSCPSDYKNSGTEAASHAGSASCIITVSGGYYIGTAGDNSSNWDKCAGGKYKAQHTVAYGSTSSCATCSAGYYCPAGASSQTACGGNTKYSGAGAAACSDVSSGYYTTGGTTNTRTGQTKCEAGNYCSGGVKTACGGGKYSSAGATSCSNITAGCYGTSASSSCPAVCGDNQYSAAGASSCSSCPADYKNSGTEAASHAGSASCIITVSGGKYIGTAGDNSSNWDTCAAGTYKAQHTVAYGSTSSCATCTGRTKYSAEGAAACSDVSSGYYTTGCNSSGNGCTAQSQCTGAEYYCTGGEQKTCPSATTYKRTTFPSDYYSPTITSTELNNWGNGKTSASQCLAISWLTSSRGKLYEYVHYNPSTGKYDNTSAYGWADVNAGYYLTTKAACGGYAYYKTVKECPEGSYCPGKSRVACNSSNQATVHTTNFGLESCSGLAGGLYPNSAAGATSASSCYTDTISGKYIATENASSATSCSKGYYKGDHTVNYGSTSSCAKVDAGCYADATGSTTSCPKSCTALASGFYPNSEAGSDAATDCYTNSISGMYVASANATSATSCAAGTYKGSHQVNYGSTSSCGTCPANSYCTTGASAATACSTLASGFYPNSAAGSDAATDCKTNSLSGKYVASVNATSATSCAAGTYKGAHQVNYGSTSSCGTCPANSYCTAGASAATACSTLASGFYPNSAAGSDASTDCYTNVIGGKYVASAKASSATSCAAGTFKGAHIVNYGSTSSCDSCALGSYSVAGADACTACQGGKTTSGTGKSSCDATCANNNNYDSTWATATWSDNAVANLCQIATCAGGSRYTSTQGAATGTLPSGYTQLAYLESTGTQYINTGVVGKSGISVDALFIANDTTSGSLFGNRMSGDTRFWPAMWFASSGTTRWDVTVNTDNFAGTFEANTLYRTSFFSDSNGWTFSVNGKLVSYGAGVNTSNTNNMYMFGINNNNSSTLQYPFKGKAYFANIYENGVLIKHLIPAKRDSDGALGMYDTVNNKFLVNAGSGKFVAGPAILKSQNTCTQCDAGTYSAGGTATSCETCANWTYSSAGASSCSACLAVPDAVGGVAWTKASGTGWDAFNDCVVTQTPANCASGSVKRTQSSASAWGSTTLVSTLKSNAGYYASATATSCTICPAGSYCAANATAATGCPGSMTSDTGSVAITDCKISCDAGYMLAAGASACTACSGGYYCESGATYYYNATAVQGRTGKVTAGYYSSGGGLSATGTCLSGYSCGSCSTGTGANGRLLYSDAGAEICSECPAATGTLANRVTSYSGWWSNNIHNKVTGCYANFSDSDDTATFRTLCYYNATDGTYGGANSSCQVYAPTECAGGYYSVIESATEWNSSYAGCKGADCMKGKVCGLTDAGYYSPAGATTQTACAIGSYTNATGKSACTACSAGKTTSGAGKTGCDATCSNATGVYGWATPKWSANSVSNLCTVSKCNANTYYTATTGTGYKNTCTSCGSNSSTSAGNTSTTCTCTTGYTSTGGVSGATTSKSGCSLISDIACAIGEYVPASSTTCSACTAGYYCPSTAKTYSYSSSIQGRTACAEGTYQPDTGKTSCTPASKGYYVSGTAKTAQTACTGATYAASQGQSSCTQCPTATNNASKATSYSYYNTGGTADHTTVTGCYVHYSNDTVNNGSASLYYCYADTDAATTGEYGVDGTSKGCWVYWDKLKCDGGYYNKNYSTSSNYDFTNKTIANLKANACIAVGAGNWSANDSLTRTACTSPLTTIGYGTAANEAEDCGRKLHAGANVIYLRSDKRTSPSLRVKVGDTTFYGALSTSLSSPLKVKNGSTTYSVVNDWQ